MLVDGSNPAIMMYYLVLASIRYAPLGFSAAP